MLAVFESTKTAENLMDEILTEAGWDPDWHPRNDRQRGEYRGSY